MLRKAVPMATAAGLVALLSAAEPLETTYKTLTYRTYRVDLSGRAMALTEERYEFVSRDLNGRTRLRLTVRKLPDGEILEKDIPVVTTRFGNLERRGELRWSPYRPRIIEREYDTRIDYTTRMGAQKMATGRSFMLSYGLREATYAGKIYKAFKVRSDIFENNGSMTRYKCVYVFELRTIAFCREQGTEADIETRLEKVEN